MDGGISQTANRFFIEWIERKSGPVFFFRFRLIGFRRGAVQQHAEVRTGVEILRIRGETALNSRMASAGRAAWSAS